MFSSIRAFRRAFSARSVALALSAAAVVAAPPAFAHGFKVGSIEVGHPWSRATPPGATTGAGYLKLKNDGTQDDRLVSASSPAAPNVQIHEMKVENGVMSMRQVDGVPVPAGKEVELAPSGIHLMLVGLREPLKEGDKVPLTLRFEKAGTVDVWLAVDKLGAGSGEAHVHNEHEGHATGQ